MMRGNRGSAGGDGDSETLKIEKSMVGLIIGRAGENLRRVEGTTGARVQFMDGPESNSTYRHCKISGSRTAVAQARAEIYRVMDDNERQKAEIGISNRNRVSNRVNNRVKMKRTHCRSWSRIGL